MPKLLKVSLRGAGIRSLSTKSRFTPATSSEISRKAFESLKVQEPTVFKNQFQDLPAIEKWFKQSADDNDTRELNSSYLEEYGSTIVPLELTRSEETGPDAKQRSSFERFEAPLSLLISHMTSSDHSSALYLAQCSLDELPADLRVDLPAPKLLSHLGRGDIYASSLWMGRPPTRTPLHRDPNPNLFVQLAGRKVVRLMRPEHGRQLYERRSNGVRAHMRGEEMMAGDELESLEGAVWDDSKDDQNVAGVEATLESGDALLIPLGWWHAVHGIGKGANASVNWWFR
jgi:hypothetical protein